MCAQRGWKEGKKGQGEGNGDVRCMPRSVTACDTVHGREGVSIRTCVKWDLCIAVFIYNGVNPKIGRMAMVGHPELCVCVCEGVCAPEHTL